MISTAYISECEQYRYSLTRKWGEGFTVNFIMLNPSTADASVDDPTIRRCLGFAKSWGFEQLVVTNLFAFRATDPKALKRAKTRSGPSTTLTSPSGPASLSWWSALGALTVGSLGAASR